MSLLSYKMIPVAACFFLFSATLFAQRTITGRVIDSANGTPLAGASVFVKGSKNGAISNGQGYFSVSVPAERTALVVMMEGYTRKTFTVIDQKADSINLPLAPFGQHLGEVMVRARSKRYSNKDNPAVDFIREVIAHKAENRINRYKAATYDKYQKMVMYVSDIPEWIAKSKLLNPYRDLLDNQDSTMLDGKSLSPLYMEEKVSHEYFQRSPNRTNSKTIGEKRTDYGPMIDAVGISDILSRLNEDINIYDNTIDAFTRQFISPIADGAPAYYKYYITDTVLRNNRQWLALYITPKNTNALVFTGTMEISLDGRYAVGHVELRTNRNMNLGVVRRFNLEQTFVSDSTYQLYYLSNTRLTTEFALTKRGVGMVGDKEVNNSRFTILDRIEDSLLKKDFNAAYINSVPKNDSFFDGYRSHDLTETEAKVYAKIDSLQNSRGFRTTMGLAKTVFSEFIPAGKVELGPVPIFLGYNPVEGLKPGFGLRTLPTLNSTWYLEGFAAYGIRDQRLKYYGAVSYSLNKRSVYLYPKHYLKASYRYDTQIPGIGTDATESNLLYSIRGGGNEQLFYNRVARLDYVHEFGNHFMLMLGIKNKFQQPGGSLYFMMPTPNGFDTIPSLNSTESLMLLRWAPGERFYQTGSGRVTVHNRFPVFNLEWIHGFTKPYRYDRLDASITKRWYVAPLGYMDIRAEAGTVIGKVPWPLLKIQQGNQSAGWRPSGYNMMNYLEFLSDRYAGMSIDHFFKGFFLDKIPLIKKLKWREMASFRAVWGGLRAENQPYTGSGNWVLPQKGGEATTTSFGNGPYMEAGFGVSNIFKVLSVIAIKRLSYLDNPGAKSWGIRLDFHVEL